MLRILQAVVWLLLNLNKLILKIMKELLFKNWKTTLFGVVSLVLFALVSFGVISPEQKEGINQGVQGVISSFDGGVTGQAISGLLLVLGNIALLFAKDPGKQETKKE
jgi:hypothetical protein